MDCFVRRFQPDRYELWKNGQDVGPHPEDDQSKLYPKNYKRRPTKPKIPEECTAETPIIGKKEEASPRYILISFT